MATSRTVATLIPSSTALQPPVSSSPTEGTLPPLKPAIWKNTSANGIRESHKVIQVIQATTSGTYLSSSGIGMEATIMKRGVGEVLQVAKDVDFKLGLAWVIEK